MERARRLNRFALVVEAYAAGRPIADICSEFDVSPALVCRYASAAGLSRNKDRAAQRPAIVADYITGLPIADICTKYSIDRKTIWSFARIEGAPLRQKHRKPKEAK